MKAICDALQQVGLRAMSGQPFEFPFWLLNIPPGMSKSTIVSLLFPAWCWAVNPETMFLTASYNAKLALKQSRESRDIVLSDKYKMLFPYVVLKGTAEGEYYTTRGGGRITTSTGSNAQGFHAHIIILDDPQTYSSAMSETERNTCNEWFDGSLPSRMKTPGYTPIIVVQQRLHPRDLTQSILSKNAPVFHISLPAELSGNVLPKELQSIYIDGLLDPARISRKVLDERKLTMGSKVYEAQMNQNPSGDENSVIKEAWLRIVSIQDWFKLIKDKDIKVDFYMDTAYTEKKSNDPSALIAVTVIDNVMYVLKCEDKHLEFPALIEWVEQWTEANGYTYRSIIKIEPKASGKSVVQMLKSTKLNIIEDKNPVGSKFERLNSIAAVVESGKVALVEGAWNSAFIHQVTQNYPPHDDMRDTFVSAVTDKLIENASSGNYSFSFL